MGTENFPYTSSANDLLKAVTALYDRIVDKNLLIRRLSISANKLLNEAEVPREHQAEQLDLFTDYAEKEKQAQADETAHARERKIQEAMLGIKKRYGKNAILKGMTWRMGRHRQGAESDDWRASRVSGPYDDIIHLSHPTSKNRPRMSIHDRAAQFSPFAALSGHAAAIAETARLTDRKLELDEDTKAELDRRQAILLEHISERPEITVPGSVRTRKKPAVPMSSPPGG